MLALRIINYEKMIVSMKPILGKNPFSSGHEVSLGVALHRGKLFTTNYSDHRVHCYRINLVSPEYLLFYLGFELDENSTIRRYLLKELIHYIGLMEYYHCYS
jgi:hypothetical protein